ncbi:MAG: hypothetical protein PUK42_08205, partial [Prevotellaceae bacterium]|nr:hypothetical protein [Prevotellaceae bacterium]
MASSFGHYHFVIRAVLHFHHFGDVFSLLPNQLFAATFSHFPCRFFSFFLPLFLIFSTAFSHFLCCFFSFSLPLFLIFSTAFSHFLCCFFLIF